MDRHDLVKLTALCKAENPEFEQIMQKCIALTEYGVQPRYPNGMEIIEDDMNRALRFAKDIKSFIREKVPELFQPPVKQPDVKKGRFKDSNFALFLRLNY